MGEQTEKLETRTRQIQELSSLQQVIAVCAGILLPILAFMFGAMFTPEWQSKTIESYISALLTPSATWPFWPFIIFSMISLGFVVSNKNAVKHLRFRVGLYIGMLWSFQYVILLPFALGEGETPVMFYITIFGTVTTLIPIFGCRFFKKLSSQKKRILIFCLLIGLVIAVFWCIAIDSPAFFFIIFFGSLVASPFWCFTVYLLMSIYACRQYRRMKSSTSIKTVKGIGLGLAYLFSYTGSWWISVKCMLIEYSKLPTEPPDCYIATAAANGHRCFVRSEDVMLTSGQTMRVNAQLRYLKCGELMIKAAVPIIHRFIRVIYDAFGPVLARCLIWPVLADATYILLKPAEWIVRGVLHVICGNKYNMIENLYKTHGLPKK
jgi:hypothetical protein